MMSSIQSSSRARSGHRESHGSSTPLPHLLQEIITPNELRSNKSTRLYTCAIRLAAIYGPGEEHHLPRILSLAKLGLAPFKIGGPNVKTDWVYADKIVLALILASTGLLDDIPGRK